MPLTRGGIHYEVVGDGPATVLMLPGLGCSIKAWEAVAARLDGYRLVLLDLPGHAGSLAAKADGTSVASIAVPVLEACDEMGLGAFSIVGLSFGSTIGVRMAIERPHQVRSVLAFMPWPASGADEGDPIMQSFLGAYGNTTAITAAITNLSLNPGRTSDVVKTMTTAVSESFWRTWYGGGVFTSMYQELDSVRVPITYVLAGKDAVAPRDRLIEDVLAIPNGRMLFLSELGHLAPYEDPEVVAVEVTDFLRRYA